MIVFLRSYLLFFFFNDTATTEIYTLSLHDALPISPGPQGPGVGSPLVAVDRLDHERPHRLGVGPGIELGLLDRIEHGPADRGVGVRRCLHAGGAHVRPFPARARSARPSTALVNGPWATSSPRQAAFSTAASRGTTVSDAGA